MALYAWLEPTYGVFPALSIVGGVPAVIALVLISDAMILSRGRPGNEKGTAMPKTIEVPPSPLPLSVTPAPLEWGKEPTRKIGCGIHPDEAGHDYHGADDGGGDAETKSGFAS